MVNARPFYDEARARLGIGPTAIVVGLLRWHAGELRSSRRGLEAITLERSARFLAGEAEATRTTIDSWAVVVSEHRRPLEQRPRAWGAR